jgi:hypothetical protein
MIWVYIWEDQANATQTMTATHTTVKSLTRRVKRVGHELYMDNFPPLWIYSMNCMQDLSVVVQLSEFRIVKECQETLTVRH